MNTTGLSPYRYSQAAPKRMLADGTPPEKPSLCAELKDLVLGQGDGATFPEVSGFAAYSEEQLLAVRDTKSYHRSTSTFGLVDKATGAYQHIPLDSSATGTPFDLEGLTPTGQEGEYLAVEGSRFLGRTPRLLKLRVAEQKAQTLEAHELPKFAQEIEGIALRRDGDGESTVLLAGRGGDGPGELYWGRLTAGGLVFDESGRQGVAVPSPGLDPHERGLTDLATDEEGRLWATSAPDDARLGEVPSTVRQIGHWTSDGERPFALDPGACYLVEGDKLEALALEKGTIYLGSDNESLNGRFQALEV